jgi:hypothetical protein
MDKFQHWVVTKDVVCANTIDLSSLTPIRHPMVKEFFVVNNLVERRCHEICGLGDFGNHY